MDQQKADLGAEQRYPIRVVSEQTGVNSVTLRAWERRYGLIVPQRTPKGHRLYSLADIERVKQIVQLLEQGSSLAAIRATLCGTDLVAGGEQRDLWQGYLDRMQRAICNFDEAKLDAQYSEAMSLYPVPVVMNRILLPLLAQLGQRWQRGEGTVAEEHFFGVYVRNKLGARLHHSSNPPRGAKLVAACMPGEYHDFGLLLFALVAREHGLQQILLGPNTPLLELAGVVARSGADGIVLSATKAPDTATLTTLQTVISSAEVPVFVGGAGADAAGQALHNIGALVVGCDLVEGVKRIRSRLMAD